MLDRNKVFHREAFIYICIRILHACDKFQKLRPFGSQNQHWTPGHRMDEKTYENLYE